ncbi:MAG TPA: hypothetical protein VK904_06305, partial [Miltoncostaeaceae bacterium]|nr:hypothetical protein [Miltoncostaeaceae bacterium]
RADDALIALQRSAGNRAVSNLVLRQGGGGLSFSPTVPPPVNLNLPPTSRLAAAPPAMTPDVEGRVRAFLGDATRRYEIGDRVGKGAISMPEVVQMVREGVPEAASAPTADIERQVKAVFGALTPPPTRRQRTAQGAGSELAARIGNALSSVANLRVSFLGGAIQITSAGLVAKVGPVTATGTPGGGEVKAGDGDASVAVTGSTTAFGLTAKLDRASFEAKVEKDEASGRWSRWEYGLRVALVGDEPIEEMTDLSGLQESVRKTEEALRKVVEHLQSGGSPTDPVIKDLMKDVKPAVEGVKRVVQKPAGPRVTIGVVGKEGDEKLGRYAGLSLVIEF